MIAVVLAAVLALPAGALAAADLSVEKRDSVDPATVDSPFEYLIAVANLGPDAATAVELSDDLPNKLDFRSAQPSQGTCENQGRKVTCALGTLASGAVAGVEIRVTPKRAGTITNTASVTSDDDPVAANNQDTETTRIVEADRGPNCRGTAATIVGTNGDDVITGTNGRDVIVAGPGDDRIRGFGGRDLICAGGGNDRVRGYGKGDVIRGAGGRDRIRGGDGNDTLRGGAGRDRLNGGRGADQLNGGAGRDRCIGGPGKDRKRRC